ncbi:Glycerophosphodiester phosphodiesterase [Lentibacillus sp. JNUCC-1]|uniref:glycerophosphodiester phosphodiesterase n=1 Tax=Lentibacillus sp. JNUCC-1 TaxID=2654513 RepID=UPI0012E84352|nr:glycerophosphodiester phosphodiesterase [Lentibacillus sp. JNUCC-1]MUV39710.1 Glycerophosphodiester phosphodiesterase [Lentibacillus sp. JNUCC-1]
MQTMIIAHRGASKQAPENTLPAFDLAWQAGAEGIETDVQLTKDHVPVLIHDERINRTTNGSGYVKDYTFNELKQFDAGGWFDKSFSGTGIISLDDFLNWLSDKPLYLNLELKNNKIEYKDLEVIVVEHLNHYRILNDTTLSSFNPHSIERLNQMNPEIDTALLVSKKRGADVVQKAHSIGAKSLHIKYKFLTPALAAQCRQKNIALRVFTVNSSRRMAHCFQTACTGIFTDLPDKALQFRHVFNNHAPRHH